MICIFCKKIKFLFLIKKLSLLVFLTHFIRCSEIPNNKEINTYIPKKSNIFNAYTNNYIYNGYDPDECVDGNIWEENDYHKILIFTEKYGIFVSNYAYASKHFHHENKLISCNISCNWICTKFIDVYYINILNNISTLQFINEIRLNVLKEIKNVYISTHKGFLNAANEVYLSYHNIKLLTESEYEIWMQEHPETKIMRY